MAITRISAFGGIGDGVTTAVVPPAAILFQSRVDPGSRVNPFVRPVFASPTPVQKVRMNQSGFQVYTPPVKVNPVRENP